MTVYDLVMGKRTLRPQIERAMQRIWLGSSRSKFQLLMHGSRRVSGFTSSQEYLEGLSVELTQVLLL
jgi:hypothetical protein